MCFKRIRPDFKILIHTSSQASLTSTFRLTWREIIMVCLIEQILAVVLRWLQGGGWTSRYKLPGPGRSEGERRAGILHLFLSFSVLWDVIRQWLVVLTKFAASGHLTTTLSALFPYFSPCRFALSGSAIQLFYRGSNPGKWSSTVCLLCVRMYRATIG